MMWCKNCRGKLYEEEIFYDEDHKKNIQIGCLACSKKVYVQYDRWERFKKDLEGALRKRA